MSQPQSQQQQQQQHNNAPIDSNKKKKSSTTNRSKADKTEHLSHNRRHSIASDDASRSATHTPMKVEKRPLHTSMEQLQMQMQSILAPSCDQKPANVNRKHAGSNWNSRRSSRDSDTLPTMQQVDAENNKPLSKSARLRQKRKAAQRNKYVAMDCEMVGVGYNGQDDMLARVSIVNRQGDVLLDKFVKPQEHVTDFRTSVSGIRPHDIEHGDEFGMVQDEVVELLQGKILVGHAIRNDLAVLHIKHPFKNIRDTSRYRPLCRLVSNGHTPSLKRLSQAILGQEIQIGEHNSVEDARAAMSIYNCLSKDWEKYLQKTQHRNHK